LDNYELCRQACEYEDTPEEVEECISDLRRKGHLCKKEGMSDIESRSGFKKLIRCFIKLLKIIYSIRLKHRNKFDAELICVVSKLIDTSTLFGFPLVKLKEVSFPGDGTYRDGFPSSLYQYMMAMAYIDSSRSPSQFAEFAADFQPWSRMLATFVNHHGGNVPDISVPSHYGTFAEGNYEDLLKDRAHLQENILRIIL